MRDYYLQTWYTRVASRVSKLLKEVWYNRKHANIRPKNWQPHCYSLSLGGQKIKNIKKNRKYEAAFLCILDPIAMGLPREKIDIHNKYMI